jgi:hypothetical protein
LVSAQLAPLSDKILLSNSKQKQDNEVSQPIHPRREAEFRGGSKNMKMKNIFIPTKRGSALSIALFAIIGFLKFIPVIGWFDFQGTHIDLFQEYDFRLHSFHNFSDFIQIALILCVHIISAYLIACIILGIVDRLRFFKK